MKSPADEPLDFSTLDPGRDPADLERRIGRITGAAQDLLRQRRAAGTVARQMLVWAKPILSLAAAFILVALGLFWYADRPAVTAPTTVLAQTETKTPAYTVVTWAVNNHAPNPAELFELDWRSQK